ncbi:MAG: DUF445 family protein [Clostridiales bacterium]|nr:DUF445 family protein [Clostridiales bacterium]
MNIQLTAAPLIGAAIGYITNDLAIKMLFHPRKAVYIGKFHVPMTPGLIPKEKNRIAKSLGRAIADQLLNSEVLQNALFSDDMTDKLRCSIDAIAERNRDNGATVNEIMFKFLSEASVRQLKDSIKGGLQSTIEKFIRNENIGERAADALLDYAREQIQGTFLGMFGSMLDEKMRDKIADMINDMLDEKAGDYISEYLDRGIEGIADKRICDIIENHGDKLDELKEFIINIYKNIIGGNLDRILKAVDLEKIVEERISGFDVAELEALIFGIMKKELNMIVYLGAVLGFLMGCVNAALSFIK